MKYPLGSVKTDKVYWCAILNIGVGQLCPVNTKGSWTIFSLFVKQYKTWPIKLLAYNNNTLANINNTLVNNNNTLANNNNNTLVNNINTLANNNNNTLVNNINTLVNNNNTLVNNNNV